MATKKTSVKKVDWNAYNAARVSKPLTITLTEDVREKLDRMAERRGWKRSQMIAHLVTSAREEK